MSDPHAVKRALRALADGTDGTHDPTIDSIDQAATAVQDLHLAATFLERHGTDRLRRSIRRAERRGDHERARRGQRALAPIEWFRRVA